MRTSASCRASRMRWSGATAPASRRWSAILTGLREPDAGEVRFAASRRRRSRTATAGDGARRLRLSAFDDHSRPDRRREPLYQPPAAARAASSAGSALRRQARELSISWNVAVSEDIARRRSEGRSAPARGDRPRALVRRPLHHSRRADRAARRRRDQAPVPAHARIAGAGRDLSVHLASSAGSLRNLPGRDGAARRAAYRHRAGRSVCRKDG